MFTKTLINVSTSFCNVVGEGIMVTSSQKKSPARYSSSTIPKDEMSENVHTEGSEASYDTGKVATNVSLYLSLTSLSSIIS